MGVGCAEFAKRAGLTDFEVLDLERTGRAPPSVLAEVTGVTHPFNVVLQAVVSRPERGLFDLPELFMGSRERQRRQTKEMAYRELQRSHHDESYTVFETVMREVDLMIDEVDAEASLLTAKFRHGGDVCVDEDLIASLVRRAKNRG